MRKLTFFSMLCCASVGSATDPASIEFFEKSVRPVLAEQCYSCHGEKKQSAGLRLDRKIAAMKGSDVGPVIVPGKPEQSSLIQAIRHSGEVKMPPKTKLSQPAIEALTAWVKMGAPYPDDAPVAVDSSKPHWAFQPVRDVQPPATKIPRERAIDRFVQAKLDQSGNSLSSPADRRTLIRRASYDLTGLLPTPEEVEAFVADQSPLAYERLVDRLLESPQYGEHQARHWMDLARYSDTKGYVFTEDRNYPFAFTYRDWLIRSFNEDMPYDRFVQFQLAADRLVKADKQNLAAMGFLTVGRRFLNNTHDIIDDRIDVTFRTFQGLTVTCARCHDHKYDPIPTKDYYSLYGVFASSQEPKDLPLIEEPKDTPAVLAFQAELKKREEVVRQATVKLRGEYQSKLRTPTAIAEYLRAARDAQGSRRGQLSSLADSRKLNATAIGLWKNYLDGKAKNDPLFKVYRVLGAIPDSEFKAKAPAELAKLVAEKEASVVVKALDKKKPDSFADVCKTYGEMLAAPGQDKSLAAVLGTGGPLDFNEQVFDRVINRKERDEIRGLKRKVDEYRAKSPVAPSRAMVMTEGSPTQPVVFLRGNPGNRGPRVPRQFPSVVAGPDRKPFSDGSGRLEMAAAIADPKNPLTARVMVNRVWGHLFGQGFVRTPSDFGIRCDPPTHPELLDWLSARFVESGWSVKKLHRLIVLSETYGQGSSTADPKAEVRNSKLDDPENRLLGRMSRKRLTFEGLRDNLLKSAGRLDPAVGGRSVDLFRSPFTARRAVYGFIDRQNLPGTFRSFDLALPDTHAPQRFTTTVPQQALFLMNAPFVMEQARALASRTEGQAVPRIEAMYRLAFSRKPTSEEAATALEFVNLPADAGSKLSPWEQLAQVLLASNEFAFVD